MSGQDLLFDPLVLARCGLPLRSATRASRPGLSTSKRPGPGWEMHAVRSYEFGDDPRRVDWNASARTGDLQVRTGLADVAVRLHLLPLLDGSMRFGTARTKHDTAVEALAFLTALAARRGDRALLQTAEAERLLLPARRPETLVASLLATPPDWEDVSDPVAILRTLGRCSVPTLLVVVADLLSLPRTLPALEETGRDLLLVVVTDPLELDPPATAAVLTDHHGRTFHRGPLTGVVRERYRAEVLRRIEDARSRLAELDGTFLLLRTDESVSARMLETLGVWS